MFECKWDDELKAAQEARNAAVAAAERRRDDAVKAAEWRALKEERQAYVDFNADIARADDTFERVRARKCPPQYHAYLIARLDAERDHQAAIAAADDPVDATRSMAAYRAWIEQTKRTAKAHEAALKAAERLLPKAPEKK